MIGKLLFGVIVGAAGARGLKCTFGHKWNGCTCEKCGTVRDACHRMVRVSGECTEECAICGKTRETKHKFKKDPDTGDHICVICGTNKESVDAEKRKPLMMLGLCGGVPFGILLLMALIEANMIWLVVLLVVLGFLCWVTAMLLRHLRSMRQQDIDILNSDVHKMGGDEAARRAEKYRDK